MDYEYFLCVIGLVMVIEGLPYAAFPGKIKGWLRQILEVPESTLRVLGFFAMFLGIIFVYMGRG